jgi:hypothetical protein
MGEVWGPPSLLQKYLLQLATCHDRDSTTTTTTTTPRLARTSAGAGAPPGVQGPPERGSCGFNAARGRCSGELRSK